MIKLLIENGGQVQGVTYPKYEDLASGRAWAIGQVQGIVLTDNELEEFQEQAPLLNFLMPAKKIKTFTWYAHDAKTLYTYLMTTLGAYHNV